MILAVGVGPGAPEYLTQKAKQAIQSADIILGFKPSLNTVRGFIREGTEVFESPDHPNEEKYLKYMATKSKSKKCVVLFVGDPNFSGYEFVDKISRFDEVEIVPGISSIQVAASKARVAFEDSVFVSFHKGTIDSAKGDLLTAIKSGKNVLLLPRPFDFMPKDIAKFLLENGISPEKEVIIYEYLTLNEKMTNKRLGDIKEEFSDVCVMVIKR